MADQTQKQPVFDNSDIQPFLEQLNQQQQQKAANPPPQPGMLRKGTAAVIRMVAPFLASEGGVPGAAIGGAGEGLAELVGGEPFSPGAVSADAALSAIPLGKIFKEVPAAESFLSLPSAERVAAVAKNALRGGLYGETGNVLRRVATGGNVTPQSSDEWKGDVIGTLMGMLPAPFLTKKGVAGPAAPVETHFEPHPIAPPTNPLNLAKVGLAPGGGPLDPNAPRTSHVPQLRPDVYPTQIATPPEAPSEPEGPLSIDADGNPHLDQDWALSKKFKTKDAAAQARDLADIDGVLVSKRAGWVIIPKDMATVDAVTEPSLEDAITQNMADKKASRPNTPASAVTPVLTQGQEPGPKFSLSGKPTIPGNAEDAAKAVQDAANDLRKFLGLAPDAPTETLGSPVEASSAPAQGEATPAPSTTPTAPPTAPDTPAPSLADRITANMAAKKATPDPVIQELEALSQPATPSLADKLAANMADKKANPDPVVQGLKQDIARSQLQAALAKNMADKKANPDPVVQDVTKLLQPDAAITTPAPSAGPDGGAVSPTPPESIADKINRYRANWDTYFDLKNNKAPSDQVRAAANAAGIAQADLVSAITQARTAGLDVPEDLLKQANVNPKIFNGRKVTPPINPNSDQLVAMSPADQDAALAKQVARSPKAPIPAPLNNGATATTAPFGTTYTTANGQPYNIVVNLDGATSGKDAQARIATAIRSLMDSAPASPQVEWRPGKAYGGREGTVLLNGNPIANVDRYGSLRLPYGANAEDLGLQNIELNKNGTQPRIGELERNLAPSQQGKSAVQFIRDLISKSAPPSPVTIQIPNGPTYTVPLDKNVLERAAQQIESDPSAFQDLVGTASRPTTARIDTPYGTSFNAKDSTAPGYRLPLGNQKGFGLAGVLPHIGGALAGAVIGAPALPGHPLAGAGLGAIAGAALTGANPFEGLHGLSDRQIWDSLNDMQIGNIVSGPATLAKIGVANTSSLLQQGLLRSVAQKSPVPFVSAAKEAVNLPQLAKDFVATLKKPNPNAGLDMGVNAPTALQKVARYMTKPIGAIDTAYRMAAERAGMSPEEAAQVVQQGAPTTATATRFLKYREEEPMMKFASPVVKAPINLLEKGIVHPVQAARAVINGTSDNPARDIAKVALAISALGTGYSMQDKLDTLPTWQKYLALAAAGSYNVPAALGYAIAHAKEGSGMKSALQELARSVPLGEGIETNPSKIVSNRLIPGFVRQLNPDYRTGTKRFTHGLGEEIQSQIPGLAQELPAKPPAKVPSESARELKQLTQDQRDQLQRIREQIIGMQQ